MTSDSNAADYRFEDFVLEPGRRRLSRRGERLALGARAFDILCALIERRDRVVGKGELLDLVWPNAAIEDGNLHVHVSALRRLIGRDAIATIPGRGYRFAANVGVTGSAAPRAALAGPAAKPAARGNLPPVTGPLLGRKADLASLTALLADHRVVSVVGPAGIGKTRLAQAVAADVAARAGVEVWLVELAPIDRAERVTATIARGLGLAPGAGAGALASLAAAIAGRPMLLLLDNCEHLAAEIARVAGALNGLAPDLRILATSQTPLRLAEEQVFRLGPLATPEPEDLASALDFPAVALFVARVRALDSRFQPTPETLAAVVEICRRLEGVPLAIELAAARAPVLGLNAVRQGLDELPRLLAGGPRDAAPRLRAFTSALEWSWGLLSDDEAHVLDRLGTFAGGFSLEAARRLIGEARMDRWTVVEHLSTLVEASLVIVGSGDPPRYRLLETTRAHALRRLAAAGALDAARRDHALAVIATLRAEGSSVSPLTRARAFAPEIDNLRAAVTWATGPRGDRAIAVALAAASDIVWYVLGYSDEGAALFRAVEPWVDGDIPAEIAAKYWLSRAKLWSAAVATAAETALRAADVFRSLGEREALFDALAYGALQFSYAGEPAAAEAVLDEARSLLDSSWPAWMRVVYDLARANVSYFAGDLVEARRQLCAGLDFARGVGDEPYFAEQMEMVRIGCDVALGRADAVSKVAEAFLGRDDPPVRGFARAAVESFQIAAWIHGGELATAEARLRLALPRFTHAFGTARTTLCHLAYLAARQRRFADAARLLGAVEALRPPGAPILAPPNRSSFDRARDLAIAALGEAAFVRERELGGAMSEADALALALPPIGE